MNANIPADIPVKEKTYDDLFKEFLETFPPHLVVAFLNSTFKHDMPAESKIESLRTELNDDNRVTADYFLKVVEPDETTHYFHVEAQTKNDNRMVFRMVEYGLRFAYLNSKTEETDDIVVEIPNAVVFYLRDNQNTPKSLNVTIKAPQENVFRYTIPTERLSEYTPQMLIEQNKFPLFPFCSLNFKDSESEKSKREWKEGCAKLGEFVETGRIAKSDAEKLLRSSRIVIGKTKLPEEIKEDLKKMTMFDVIGVDVDWLEIKRQKEEAVRQAKLDTARTALEKGMSVAEAAELAHLPISEVEAIVGNE